MGKNYVDLVLPEDLLLHANMVISRVVSFLSHLESRQHRLFRQHKTIIKEMNMYQSSMVDGIRGVAEVLEYLWCDIRNGFHRFFNRMELS